MADNVFDDTLYSAYILNGYVIPATDGTNITAKLRDATPADAVTIGYCGGDYTDHASLSTSVYVYNGYIALAVGNTTGRGAAFYGELKMSEDGENHWIALNVKFGQSGSTPRYSIDLRGEFIDTTPRQGISFQAVSGNVTGWLEVLGVPKQ